MAGAPSTDDASLKMALPWNHSDGTTRQPAPLAEEEHATAHRVSKYFLESFQKWLHLEVVRGAADVQVHGVRLVVDRGGSADDPAAAILADQFQFVAIPKQNLSRSDLAVVLRSTYRDCGGMAGIRARARPTVAHSTKCRDPKLLPALC